LHHDDLALLQLLLFGRTNVVGVAVQAMVVVVAGLKE
jgi:hypothetical protein